jgi:hypothetical protein
VTIAAESFAGRVLAVFSRRSPGFRPPVKTASLLPTPDSSSAPASVQEVPHPRETSQNQNLSAVASDWKTLSPTERLRFRSVLLTAAVSLDAATEALARDHDRAVELAQDLEHARDRTVDTGLTDDLERADLRIRTIAIGLASIRAIDPAFVRDQDFVPVRDRGPALARVRAGLTSHFLNYLVARDRERALNQALDSGLALSASIRVSSFTRGIGSVAYRAVSRTIDRTAPVLSYVQDLVVVLDHDLRRHRDRAIELARSITHMRSRISQRDIGVALYPVCELARAFAHDLDRAAELNEAQDNLIEAANNFVGADLTAVRLGTADLAGIHWDDETRWPTLEWKARISRASVEDPPGSGIYTVLPEEGRDFADRESLSPIS